MDRALLTPSSEEVARKADVLRWAEECQKWNIFFNVLSSLRLCGVEVIQPLPDWSIVDQWISGVTSPTSRMQYRFEVLQCAPQWRDSFEITGINRDFEESQELIQRNKNWPLGEIVPLYVSERCCSNLLYRKRPPFADSAMDQGETVWRFMADNDLCFLKGAWYLMARFTFFRRLLWSDTLKYCDSHYAVRKGWEILNKPDQATPDLMAMVWLRGMVAEEISIQPNGQVRIEL